MKDKFCTEVRLTEDQLYQQRVALKHRISALRLRMTRDGHTQRDLAMYMGMGVTRLNKMLGGYNPISGGDIDRFNSALDQFDEWVKAGFSVKDKVVEGARYE